MVAIAATSHSSIFESRLNLFLFKVTTFESRVSCETCQQSLRLNKAASHVLISSSGIISHWTNNIDTVEFLGRFGRSPDHPWIKSTLKSQELPKTLLSYESRVLGSVSLISIFAFYFFMRIT